MSKDVCILMKLFETAPLMKRFQVVINVINAMRLYQTQSSKVSSLIRYKPIDVSTISRNMFHNARNTL